MRLRGCSNRTGSRRRLGILEAARAVVESGVTGVRVPCLVDASSGGLKTLGDGVMDISDN